MEKLYFSKLAKLTGSEIGSGVITGLAIGWFVHIFHTRRSGGGPGIDSTTPRVTGYY